MKSMHVAFGVEPLYGHVIPTLGMALELLRRGHRVSYTITNEFVGNISRLGAEPKIYLPLDIRTALLQQIRNEDGSVHFAKLGSDSWAAHMRRQQARTEDSLAQWERLYREDRPDVILHDDCLDTAARSFADKYGIARIRHEPNRIPPSWLPKYQGDQLILVSVPRFFNDNLEQFDDRFRFVGFAPEGRLEFFGSRGQGFQPTSANEKMMLFAVTTGLLPQKEFCSTAIRAFAGGPWRVIMSIVATLDPIGRIDVDSLQPFPANFELNPHAANFEILEHASLFIGQGGQGSSCEAMYHGVPLLVVPASDGHAIVGKHVEELGLGICLDYSEVTPEKLRETAEFLSSDAAAEKRVKECRQSMRNDAAAATAADFIEQYFAGRRSSVRAG